MSEAELIFSAPAELSTCQIAESLDAKGMPENSEAGKKGGRIAKNAIILYQIPRVVIGENRNFYGSEDLLRQKGVDITLLDNQECFDLLKRFITDHPDLWNEDIGT